MSMKPEERVASQKNREETRGFEQTTGSEDKRKRSERGGPRLPAVELDGDSVDAILVRLVASACTHTQATASRDLPSPAQHLSRCARVSWQWYAASLNEDLWRGLLERRSICGMLVAGREQAKLSYRAMYIRAATTRILVWGNCGNPRDRASARVRAPTLLGGDGLKGMSIKEVSVGEGYSCAVRSCGALVREALNSNRHELTRRCCSATRRHDKKLTICLCGLQLTWSGQVLCWGDNSDGQCGLPPAAAAAVSEPTLLALPTGCEEDELSAG